MYRQGTYYSHIMHLYLNVYTIVAMSYLFFIQTGPTPYRQQDSFMYRLQNGVRSLLLDDDGCDCYSTLSFGHGMCNAGFSTTYGPTGRFGVDLLYDTHCQTPDPKRGLTLYFRDDDDCDKAPCPYGRYCVDRVNSYLCV